MSVPSRSLVHPYLRQVQISTVITSNTQELRQVQARVRIVLCATVIQVRVDLKELLKFVGWMYTETEKHPLVTIRIVFTDWCSHIQYTVTYHVSLAGFCLWKIEAASAACPSPLLCFPYWVVLTTLFSTTTLRYWTPFKAWSWSRPRGAVVLGSLRYHI